jgi:hypothetical protein
MFLIDRAKSTAVSMFPFVSWLVFCLPVGAQNPARSLRGYVQDSSGARLAHESRSEGRNR